MALGSARLTEKWINRGLWLIAFIFAGFLIGLGSLIVADLPHVQKQPLLEDFVDRKPYNELKATIAKKEAAIQAVQKVQSQEEEKLYSLQDTYNKSKESFDNWVATRDSTQDKTQNPEVLKRTKSLEDELNAMKRQEEVTQKKRDEVQKLSDELEPTRQQLADIEKTGYEKMDGVIHHNQIQVFLYRLLLTLPLLLIAAWLFAKKRKNKHWPFIWGFIFFALFTFFVELVPYLPSYGGYVQYIVGIVLTFFAGQYSIKALQTYLEKQKQAEASPNTQLKEKMNYELVQQRISKSICPSCERPIDLKDPSRNFCMHCGTGVFNTCIKCNTRKNAFAKFCHSCGETA